VSQVEQEKRQPKVTVKPSGDSSKLPDFGLPFPPMQEVLRRKCAQCKNLIPVDKFDYEDKICVTCRRELAEKELANYKKGEFEKVRKAVVEGELCAGMRGLEHVSECMSELVYNFGGVEGFASAWYEQIKLAVRDKPGSKAILDHFRSLAKLWLEVSRLQHQEKIEEMNDQQLLSLKEMAVREMLTDAGMRDLMSKVIKSSEQDGTEEGEISREDELTGRL